ncbi:MAG: hypothetical protein AB7U20_13105 [Planctomycetaceae bacterium]
MLLACCGNHPADDPSDDGCHEASCTYVSTPSPELTGAAGFSTGLLTFANPAVNPGLLRIDQNDADSGPQPLSVAARCALSQVWRL